MVWGFLSFMVVTSIVFFFVLFFTMVWGYIRASPRVEKRNSGIDRGYYK